MYAHEFYGGNGIVGAQVSTRVLCPRDGRKNAMALSKNFRPPPSLVLRSIVSMLIKSLVN